MRKHSMPEMKEGSVNVTPLIDIIMCLIIFFMIVAKIGVSTGIDADMLKKAPSTFRGEQITDFANAVVLNIIPPSDATLRSQPMAVPEVRAVIGGQEKSMKVNHKDPDKSELRDFMRTERNARKDAQGNEKLKVIVNAPSTLKYYQLQQVLADLTLAGITDIYFATNVTSTKPKWAQYVDESTK